MRIVGGSARGRPLKGPKHEGVRPTSDRVRESLFNILGQRFDGIRVLDLFAGTGALGLEAVSRGAARAVLVDSSRDSLALCRENAAGVGLAERVEIVSGKVAAPLLRTLTPRGPFELILADPPYAALEPKVLLQELADAELLASGGTIVLEHDRRAVMPTVVSSYSLLETRRIGDTCLSFYREAPQGTAPSL